ncbi:MAG TPA: hypothetical protein EYG89_01200 [Bacteroidia bacterium]|nr:hypothetical protein [Bacteroidia bacterium]
MIYSNKISNILSFFFVLAIVIPYFKILPVPSEIQPHAFLLALILLIVWKKIKFTKEFYLLLFVAIVSISLLAMNTFTIVHIKEIYGYISFLIISIVSYNYFIRYGEIQYSFYRNILLAYLIVGLIQMFIDPNFFHLFLAREVGYDSFEGRGVESMTTEPTYYGLILLFIFILIYNSFSISSSNKIKLYILIFISILFISKSTTGLVGFFIFLFFHFLKINLKNIIYLLLLTIILIGLIYIYNDEIQKMRVFYLLEHLYNGGLSALIKYDQSSNDRLLHIFYSLKGFIDNSFLPNGYSSWNNYIQVQASLGDDVQYVSSKANKIFPFLGTILFELGILGFPIIFYIFYVLKKRFKNNEYIAHTVLFIFILFQALTIAYTFIPFIFSFFLYQHKVLKSSSTKKGIY